MTTDNVAASWVIERLRRLFRRNGYVRRRSAPRLEAEGYRLYKKGDEVRLTAESKPELDEIRYLLWRAGFEPGRPFVKGRLLRQPIYGRRAVARFLKLVGGKKDAKRKGSSVRRPLSVATDQ